MYPKYVKDNSKIIIIITSQCDLNKTTNIADDIFKFILLKKFMNSYQNKIKFLFKGPFHNQSTLVHAMARYRNLRSYGN